MSLIPTNWNPSRRELRVFSAILPFFSLLVGWLLERRAGVSGLCVGITATGTLLGVTGLAIESFARRTYVVWMTIVSPIGLVVSWVLLAAIFYGLFWPLGVLLRWRRGDFLQLKFDRDAETYWQPIQRSNNPRRYFRQY